MKIIKKWLETCGPLGNSHATEQEILKMSRGGIHAFMPMLIRKGVGRQVGLLNVLLEQITEDEPRTDQTGEANPK